MLEGWIEKIYMDKKLDEVISMEGGLTHPDLLAGGSTGGITSRGAGRSSP